MITFKRETYCFRTPCAQKYSDVRTKKVKCFLKLNPFLKLKLGMKLMIIRETIHSRD